MKEKHSKKFGALNLLLLVIDLALLVWIGVSCAAEKNEDAQFTPENMPIASVPSEKEPTQVHQDVPPVQPEQQPEPEQKPEPEQQPEQKPEPEQQPEQKPEPQSYETNERPTDDDFLEWYAKDVMWNGVPGDVEKITDFSQISGTWKGLIYHDPNNERDSEGVELLNFTVGGTEDTVTLTADWCSIYFVAEGKGYSKEEENDSTFTGLWLDGALEVTGSGSIHLTEFFVKDGKQYAAGTMDCVDGVFACVAMVRP